jgi:hypothetical protein
MTARKFYQQLLWLYPEPFRHEFEDEMLSIFDECRAAQGSWRVLVDLLFSAAKQQIHYRCTPVSTSASLYSEVHLSPHLGVLLGIAALSTALMAGIWAGRKTEAPTLGAVIRPEAIYWFPIVPQGRYCYSLPEQSGKPERVLTTGVWVRGNSKAPEYWTVVRSKKRFWISTTPWGQYCCDVPERTGRPEGVL